MAIAGRALENYATSNRRGADHRDDLLSDQPQSGLDGGGDSLRRREGSGSCLHIPARHLWRVFLGGYVALLTAAFVAFFHFTFIKAVALTKVLNIFSSVVATLVFARRDLSTGDWA